MYDTNLNLYNNNSVTLSFSACPYAISLRSLADILHCFGVYSSTVVHAFIREFWTTDKSLASGSSLTPDGSLGTFTRVGSLTTEGLLGSERSIVTVRDSAPEIRGLLYCIVEACKLPVLQKKFGTTDYTYTCAAFDL